jgi:hypothetical protein
MTPQQKRAAISILVTVGIILFSVLLGVSFGTLEATEVGLDYNYNNFQIDSSVLYQPGRYYIGLGHVFLKFPSDLRTIRFSGNSTDRSMYHDIGSSHLMPKDDCKNIRRLASISGAELSIPP